MKFKVFFYDGLDYSRGKFYSAQEAFNENFIEFKNNEIVPTDECSIIVISTGLKDKNGVEIYEGDLLSDPFPIDNEDLSKGYHESFLPVSWCSKTLQWCVDASFAKDGSYLTSFVEYFGEFLEVKGNIYENADLC